MHVSFFIVEFHTLIICFSMVVWNSHVAANYYHQLGRWWRNMLVSYIYIFKLTNYNLRIMSHRLETFTNGMEFITWISLRSIRFADLASSIPSGDFVSRISATLQFRCAPIHFVDLRFANKHLLGGKPRRSSFISDLKKY